MVRKILFSLLLLFAVNAVCVSAQNKSDDFQQKVMYVDFRTQVHTIDALKELARKTAAGGFTSLLLEYEATFPFEKHATLCNRFAYTKEEIADYVAYCAELGLEVIPLQNCMGHAQYILRHDRYAALREDSQDVSQVCPLCFKHAVPVIQSG